MTKRDLLSECNKQGLPVADLHDLWCFRCLNPECSRSISGTSKFEDRVQNWQERLFLNPARLDASDPRYKDIIGKRFLNVLGAEPGKQSSWDDPRDLEAATTSVPFPAAFVAPKPTAPPEPEVKAEVKPEPPVTPKVSEPPKAEDPPSPQPKPAAFQMGNTPTRSRQMIGGAEQKPAPAVLDPWQPKEALKPGETLVKPGAKIKLGG